MTLKKIGSPERIKVLKMTGSLAFDPNLVAKHIKDTWHNPTITIDQLHEAVKAMGIVDYTSDDFNEVINLLKSSGVEVKTV